MAGSVIKRWGLKEALPEYLHHYYVLECRCVLGSCFVILLSSTLSSLFTLSSSPKVITVILIILSLNHSHFDRTTTTTSLTPAAPLSIRSLSLPQQDYEHPHYSISQCNIHILLLIIIITTIYSFDFRITQCVIMIYLQNNDVISPPRFNMLQRVKTT